MKLITQIKDMQKAALQFKQQGQRIALVPTMGYLHEGHLTLVDEAKKRSDVVILSLFVNPTQFGPNEDLEKYPQDLNRDEKLAQARGVDILFHPSAEEIYTPHDQTCVLVTEKTRGLCGAFRPGHFRGVTTIVAKLFLMTQPDMACFGEKDYQQLKVIEQMVTDLKFPIQILGVPTVREPDGLALSSRNQYLNEEERKQALRLYQSMQYAQTLIQQGESQIATLNHKIKTFLEKIPTIQVQYVEIVDLETLNPLKTLIHPGRLILAVFLNGKRLIDNCTLFLPDTQ